MPRPSAQTKLLSGPFCPRQSQNCPGQKFVHGWFFAIESHSKCFFWLKNSYSTQESHFKSTLRRKNCIFHPWQSQFCLGQNSLDKSFCPGLRTRHKSQSRISNMSVNHHEWKRCLLDTSTIPHADDHNKFVERYIQKEKAGICLTMNNYTDDGLNCGKSAGPGEENFRMITCKHTYDAVYKVLKCFC